MHARICKGVSDAAYFKVTDFLLGIFLSFLCLKLLSDAYNCNARSFCPTCYVDKAP